MDLQRVVSTYIKMRDVLTAKRRAFEDEEREIKGQMKVLENAMLAQLHASKAESVRTEAGTVYMTEEVTPTGSDWDALYRWIAENNEFEALERRIKRTFVKEYMDTHGGDLPPGVSVHREYVARVRRPT